MLAVMLHLLQGGLKLVQLHLQFLIGRKQLLAFRVESFDKLVKVSNHCFQAVQFSDTFPVFLGYKHKISRNISLVLSVVPG